MGGYGGGGRCRAWDVVKRVGLFNRGNGSNDQDNNVFVNRGGRRIQYALV